MYSEKGIQQDEFTPVAECGTAAITPLQSKRHFTQRLPLKKTHWKTVDRTPQTARKTNYYSWYYTSLPMIQYLWNIACYLRRESQIHMCSWLQTQKHPEMTPCVIRIWASRYNTIGLLKSRICKYCSCISHQPSGSLKISFGICIEWASHCLIPVYFSVFGLCSPWGSQSCV